MATKPEERKREVVIWYVFAAIIGMLLLQLFLTSYSQTETIPYSQFEQLLSQNKIAAASVSANLIQGSLKEPLPSGKKDFATIRIDSEIADKLVAHGVTATGIPPGGLIQTILSWVAPAAVFYFIWAFFIRRMADRQGFGGLMGIGKSHAKVYVETDTKVTFADVAGVDEAKFELQEVVSFLKNPKIYGRLGAHAPKGILLV